LRINSCHNSLGGGGGVLPYMGYTGMCGPKGYVFFKFTRQAASRSDILSLFGQGNLIFIKEKLGNFEKGMSVAPMIGHIQNIYHQWFSFFPLL